jgi:glycosyltransferase involved in cell wall biosynthesis
LVIRLVAALKQDGVEALLHLLGEGASRPHLEALTQELDITGHVHFHGYTPATQVREFYRRADFVVQAPRAEGFGKVPIEAFFHGVIPLLSDVNLSRQLVGQGSRGRCFPLDDLDFLRQELLTLSHQPITMAEMIRQGRAYVATQTLESWQEHLEMMFSRFWGERWALSYGDQ